MVGDAVDDAVGQLSELFDPEPQRIPATGVLRFFAHLGNVRVRSGPPQRLEARKVNTYRRGRI